MGRRCRLAGGSLVRQRSKITAACCTCPKHWRIPPPRLRRPCGRSPAQPAPAPRVQPGAVARGLGTFRTSTCGSSGDPRPIGPALRARHFLDLGRDLGRGGERARTATDGGLGCTAGDVDKGRGHFGTAWTWRFHNSAQAGQETSPGEAVTHPMCGWYSWPQRVVRSPGPARWRAVGITADPT